MPHTIRTSLGRLRCRFYAGNIELACRRGRYLNGQIQHIAFPDGRLVAEYDAGGASLEGYRAEYFRTDHLGNTRLTFSDFNQDGVISWKLPTGTRTPYESEITSENHYYPFGLGQSGPWYASVAPENKYRYNGKEWNDEWGLGLYDFGNRWHDPTLGRFTTVDRFAEKYAFQSAYVMAANDPMKFVDVNGDSIFISSVGKITRNDKTDNMVFLSQNGKLTKIGELGGKIDVNIVYANLLSENTKEASEMLSPITFRNKVRNKGDWDLKNDKNSIFGLGNDGKTTFVFQGQSMESQDIGNHHFGAVAKAYGKFPSEEFILKQAGEAQIAAGTSRPEWQIYQEEIRYSFSKADTPRQYTVKVLQPPYGDDPRDQKWIKAGFKYYLSIKNKNK